ncbi:MAG: MFS transporter [Bacteroidales bacterium]|nr:MFS transporter [Bacteroidales bacterium]
MNKREGLRRSSLLAGSTLTVMAGAIIAAALPEISMVYSHLPDAELLSKLILTLPALFIALLSPVAGYIVDASGRRKVLLFALVLYALSGTTGAYMTNIYLILAGRALLGVAVGALMTAIVTLIGDYYEDRQRSSFMGYQAAFASTGGLLFISAGGILTDIHWRLPFLIYALSMIIFVMAWFSVNEPVIEKSPRKHNGSPGSFLRLVPGYVYVVYAIAFFSFAVFYMIPVQMPFILNSLEGVSSTRIGIAIAFMNITAMLTAFNYSAIKKHLAFPVIMALVYLLVAAGYALISISRTYEMMVAGILVCGLGFGMQMANINLWLVQIAPARIRGRLVGYLTAFIFLGMFLSPILLQPLIRVSSLQGSFLLVAMLLVLLAVTMFYTYKRGLWNQEF